MTPLTRRTWWIALLCAMLLAIPGLSARAQGAPPPTIIDFRADLPAIALAEAEAGETTTALSWQTVGVAAPYTLALEAWKLDAWVSLVPFGEALPTTGTMEVRVEHPLTFAPPTYRLTIQDARDAILDQQIVLIPYDEGVDAPPAFESVMAPVQSVSPSDLALGTARVPVVWEVTNRPPRTNLVFEQLVEDSLAVPVELPRANLWVPSRGEGVVAPVDPGVGQPVRLRVRLINLADGATLAGADLPPIPVAVGAAQALAPSTPVVSGTSTAQVLSFTAAPETVPRGGSVTVAWEVSGSRQVTVWRLSPTGQIAEEAPITTPTGSWSVTLPEYYVDTASFVLNAVDAAGQTAQAGLTVTIICPYTYFFETDEPLACPLGPAQTVQGAWQAFERGMMLWRADTSEILVLYTNGGRVERYRDTWQGEPVLVDEAPPPGLYQPNRGFGKVWAENPAVRSGLGWATTLEQGYTMQYQSTGDFRYPRLYLTLPDGSMIYIVETSWATAN